MFSLLLGNCNKALSGFKVLMSLKSINGIAYSLTQVLLLGLSMQTAARALVLKEGEQWGDCRSDGGCNGVDLYCYGSHNVCVKCEESACRQFHDIWSVCQKSICRGESYIF